MGSGGEGPSLRTAWEGALRCVCGSQQEAGRAVARTPREFNEGLHKAEPRAVTLPCRGPGRGFLTARGPLLSSGGQAACWVPAESEAGFAPSPPRPSPALTEGQAPR